MTAIKRPRLTLKPPPIKISEAQRQQAVINVLRSLSYEVLLIGQKRQPIFCKCGTKHWPTITGSTPGAADLLISHRRWFAGAWLALEMKAPDTRRRPEQLRLAEAGMNVIVETVEQALDAVQHLEQQMGIPPLSAMTAYREQTRREQA